MTVALTLIVTLGACQKGDTSATAPAAPEAAPTATPAPSPATPNSFAEVTAQLDPGGELYLYLSTEQWLAGLSHGVDTLHDLVLASTGGALSANVDEVNKGFAVAKDMIQKSGVQEVSGVGISSFNYAPGLYRNKLFVHHYAGNGTGLLWSLYGKTPHPLTGLDLLPVDTAVGGTGDFDIAQLINFLRQEAAQSGIPEFKQAVDQWQTQFAGISGLQLDDVLNSLSGSIGSVLTLDASNNVSIPFGPVPETIPAPRLAILIGVKNDLVFKQVDKMLASTPGIIKTEEPGLSMRTFPVPFILPNLNLRPSVAQWNGYLVIASDDRLIRDIIAVQKGAPGFKSTPEYATLSAGLPDQGTGFSVISQRFVDTFYQIQTTMQTAGPAAQSQVMARFINNHRSMGHQVAVATVLPNGILSVCQGSQGSTQMITPLIMAPIAMAAGTAMPWIQMAHKQQAPATPPFSPAP